MKILCLYNNKCALELFGWLEGEGHEVILQTERLDAGWCTEQKFDLTISYTYRYILTEDILGALGYNAVNIHNSFLPYNRGADPNLWSIIDHTPRGVTLHYMDSGLDKGFIIAQEIITGDANDGDTLSGSYNNLDKAAKSMFKRAFRYYDYWPSMKKAALGSGTYHSLKDGLAMKSIIDTYDMTISEFRARLAVIAYRGGGIDFDSVLYEFRMAS